MSFATEKGFEVCQHYLAVNLHFDPNNPYDYFKYNGKTSASFEKYERRVDRLFFEQLAKHYDFKNFITYNRAVHGYVSIENLVRLSKHKKTFAETKKNIESACYWLANEVVKYPVTKRELLESVDGQHPHLLYMHLKGHTSLLELVILNQCYNYIPYFDKTIEEKSIWPKISASIKAFSPFVITDAAKIRTQLDSYFNNELAT